jgi:hypothetical protein
MNRTEELEDQVRHLTSTVDEMKARMARLEGAEPADQNGTKRSSRRGFLRLGAAAALGSMGWAAVKALPAAAANGANFVLGQANLAESPTTLKGDIVTITGPPTPVLAAIDSTFVAVAPANSFTGALQALGSGATGNPVVEGVDGWAAGTKAFGVYGLTDAGTGVTGESSTGIGLYARASGRIRQDGQAGPGAPIWGANDFEQVRDSTGAMFISNPGGVGWKQVATTDLGLHLFPNPRRCLGNGTTTPAEAFILNIDATQKVSAGGPTGVPAGAKAAYCAVQAYQPGVMTLYPTGTPDTGTANWSVQGTSGQLLMLYMLVPLDSTGKFNIHNRFTDKQIYVDVWGYFM